ncbi:ATP-binding protein [Mesorhizobium sp. M0938]|uniref:ATP-binding protein n=1 Tax=unclassified Mesorhizobium TaxID=325217 RepID=UPI00333C20AA
MASAYQELEMQTEARSLEHGEWLALLLEREATTRRQRRFEARARAAKLRRDAQIENVDFRAARGLDRNLFLKLAACDWIRQRHSLLLIGPAGVGKSWLSCVRCAFAEQLGQCSRIGLHFPLEDRPSTLIDDANARLPLRHRIAVHQRRYGGKRYGTNPTHNAELAPPLCGMDTGSLPALGRIDRTANRRAYHRHPRQPAAS